MDNTQLSLQSQHAIANFEALETRAEQIRQAKLMVDQYGLEVLGLTHSEIQELQKDALARYTNEYGLHYDTDNKPTGFRNIAETATFVRTVVIVIMLLVGGVVGELHANAGGRYGWQIFLAPPLTYGLISETKLRSKRRTYNEILLNMSIAKSLDKPN